MWVYIILLVFVICLFSLKPQTNLIINKRTPKVICNKDEKIQDLVMLPKVSAVSLVKH